MNQALQDVIEHRRTTNVFEPNHTISDEQIEHLVHLATRAPTSFNLQNWRLLLSPAMFLRYHNGRLGGCFSAQADQL